MAPTDALFEELESDGLLTDPSLVASFSADDLRARMRHYAGLIPRQRVEPGASRFDFVATGTLSGLANTCSSPKCRKKAVEELGRFAVLFADSIAVPSPLGRWTEDGPAALTDSFIATGDIETLLVLRPLLDQGLVSFAPSDFHFCAEHTRTIAEPLRVLVDGLAGSLKRLFESRLVFEIEHMEEYAHVQVTGLEEILGHAMGFAVMGTRGRSLPSGRVTAADVADFGFVDRMVDTHADEVLSVYLTSVLSQRTVLSQRASDYALLRGGPDETCASALTTISCAVPQVLQIPLATMAELRTREPEAFAWYRDALQRFMTENPETTKLQTAFSDIVGPELFRLNALIAHHQKEHRERATRAVVYASAFLGTGLLGDFLTPDVAKIVAAVGGFTFLGKTLEDYVSASGVPLDARKSPWFFLWKLGQAQEQDGEKAG